MVRIENETFVSFKIKVRMNERIKKTLMMRMLYWIWSFLYYVGLILVAGTVVGSVAFVLLGPIFVDDYTFLGLLKKGAWIGFRYAGVWAGGVAIVLCCMKANKKCCVGKS
ncbi:MAG: hypothetical protein COZ46_01505 [Verrucomicrobia bacterium CG_4_10_14_3_um_filter_43_23]|nr:MAG: hypothetical protein AUJ82_01530 [Verrucomicrobia bacterium CG1_02_43_26]PIP59576.1 MAG: hypothetical protein COX01_03110 [Verrucomicrobia bacterium CG22_combo_CG10-13_8_21_14_all_43_17]PIX58875.1 MAG: hypothetical protein COZ46_01505 [Verrucomicrobia bacterium CG_4_10_14_3_um_filter_43_23]PIY61651.1 MAG: hypothetical protein COY94_04090 [Verrucomicrobia bacterium CG_4_10_14_0_8_um_filter_43_34]PJA44535.1 MAG: hypothetical protein CO175_02160 [Verrucomicrobia bacterium CG_4_9_14_3_um_fi